MPSSRRHTVFAKGARVIACALAFALSFGWWGSAAYADVRSTDIIAGASVEMRGLPDDECPSIDAEYACLMTEDGEVLFERKADEQVHIASITKVMTGLVALETAPLDTTVTVSNYAASVGESTAGLQAGDSMTLEQALSALLVPSGNDAAVAIAESLGALIDPNADPEAAFVAAMNEKAQALGMTGSVFSNPHGLDMGDHAAEMHCSAKDVAILCQAAMKNETFRTVVDQATADISVNRGGYATTVTLESTDLLLGVYEGACGIKTGYTSAAGPCFAGACEKPQGLLLGIVLDSTSEEQRFDDVVALYDWFSDHMISYNLAQTNTTTTATLNGQATTVPVVGYAALSAWIDKTVPVTFANPEASVEIFDFDGDIEQTFTFDDIEGEVQAGQTVGQALFYQDGQLLATQDLIACETVPAPDFFEGIGIWFQRLIAGFTGTTLQAESSVLNQTISVTPAGTTAGA
ncbi:MAG: D-alanyl-D-alanine carboxypeptidase [Eggerthellaceae bacterium]|nr:D-alanyl-D-alanine carboxypeptidase [Eggerthellaceae bacterium]